MASSINIVHEMINKVGFEFDDTTAKKVTQLAERAGKLAASGMTQEASVGFTKISEIFNNELAKLGKQKIDFSKMLEMPDSGTFENMLNTFVSQVSGGLITGMNAGMSEIEKKFGTLMTKRAQAIQQRDSLENQYRIKNEEAGKLDRAYEELISNKKTANASDANFISYAQDTLADFSAINDELSEMDEKGKVNASTLFKWLSAAKELQTVYNTIANMGELERTQITPKIGEVNMKYLMGGQYEGDIGFGSMLVEEFLDTENLVDALDIAKKKVDDLNAEISNLTSKHPELIDKQKAIEAEELINRVQEAYNRLFYKQGKNKGTINARSLNEIESSLNYVPKSESVPQVTDDMDASQIAKIKTQAIKASEALDVLGNKYSESVGKNWEQQAQSAIKFVREYEALMNNPQINQDVVEGWADMYKEVKPMVAMYEAMLQNVVNMAQGKELIDMSQFSDVANSAEQERVADEASAEAEAKARTEAEVKAKADKEAADAAERERLAQEASAKAAREKAEARRSELSSKLFEPKKEDLDGDYYDVESLENILAKNQEILSQLANENLLTEEIRTKYEAINKAIAARIAYQNEYYAAEQAAEKSLDNLDDLYDKAYATDNPDEANTFLEERKRILSEISPLVRDQYEESIAEETNINSLIERRIALLREAQVGRIDIDDIDNIMQENGGLESKLERLQNISEDWGSKVKDSELDDDEDALESLQQFEEVYDRIVLKLANGKNIEILPNAKGLRALYKYYDGLDSSAYGESEIEDVEFVRKEAQVHQENTSVINIETQALQQQKKAIEDVIAARGNLKASQTTLGVTDGKDMLGGSTLDAVKEKQKALKTYLQELIQIEAQEKKNGSLTEAEIARRRELVGLVQDMGLAVRYKDGSFYTTENFGENISEQIEQLSQLISLRKQIALGYYNTGSYGTLSDTFSGSNIQDLMYAGIGSFDDIEQFDSSIIGQWIREYQMLHEQMLRCMLVGEEVPQSTLDRMQWFESVDATQLESLIPKLTELQQKIQVLQSKDGLYGGLQEQDDAYYDQKIQDLHALLALQKEYITLNGPVNDITPFAFGLDRSSEDIQEQIEWLTVLKQGAQDVAKLKAAFPDTNLRGTSNLADVVDSLHRGSITYDDALAKVTQLIAAQKQLNDEKSKEPPTVDDTPQLQGENGALDEQNGKLKENINLKTQANGQGVGTGGTGTGTGTTPTKVTPTQTVPNGTISAEVTELEAVRAKVLEVTNAINSKTQAFTNEEAEVQRVVTSEIASLDLLEQKVTTIKGTLEGLLSNLKTGSGDIGAGLGNITVTVNKNDSVDTEQKGAWALDTTVQSIKGTLDGVRSDIGNVINVISNINTKALSADVGSMPATENTLVAIKSVLDAINGKIIKGDKTNTSSKTYQTNKTNVGTKNAEGYAGSQYFPEKLKTQTLYLAKFRAQLMTTGKLTDEIDGQIYQLLSSLSLVKNGPDLSKWNQQFLQLKTSVGIADVFDKANDKAVVTTYKELISLQKTRNQLELQYEKAADGSALKAFYQEQLALMDGIIVNQQIVNRNDEYELQLTQMQIEHKRQLGAIKAQKADDANSKQQKQEEAIIVRELVELYEQLGRARAQGDFTTAGTIRGQIKTKRGQLTTVDRATDDKFAKATAKGEQSVVDEENEAATKAQNEALRERQKILGELVGLHRELGVLEEKEKSSTISDSKRQQLRAEIYELYRQISAKEQLIILTQEEIDLLNQTYANAGRSARISNAGEREAEINKLKGQYAKLGEAQANAEHKGTNEAKERFAVLAKEIAKKKTSLQLTEQELDMLRKITAESYKTQSGILAKGKQDKDFRQQVRDSQKNAGLTRSNSIATKAETTLTNAMGLEGISDDHIAKLEQYKSKIISLQSFIEKLRNQGSPVTDAQKQELISQTVAVDNYTKEIQELIANYERLSGENATVIGTNILGTGATADDYKKELTNAVQSDPFVKGRAHIKSYDAETKTLTYTLKTGRGEFTTYTASIRQADNALVSVRGTTTKAMSAFELIGKKLKEYSYYFTGSMMVYRVIAWVREGLTMVKEIDTALTELKKVTDATEETYDNFLDTASKTASKVGSTVKDIISSTADWARLNI